MSIEPIVFVVDDDESTRTSLARLFRSVDLEVQTFSTPAAFLSHALPDRPACLVLDLRMPGASGLAVQEELARAGADLPILFLTGHADVPTTVRAMKAGAIDFLEKTMDDQALLDAIQKALGRARELWTARAERTRIERLVATLTPRECDVLRLIVTGLPNKQVADRLGAAEKTVKVHRARVMGKMKADSLAHLVLMAHAVGIAAGFGPPTPGRPGDQAR